MTRKEIKVLQCPHCQTEGKFIFYSTINVTLNPELKTALMTRKLYEFNCEKCKKITPVAHGTLYHDMRKNLFIQLILTSEDEPIELDPELKKLPLLKGMENYKFRMVKNFNELMEKILIFDDGLDDITLEILKFGILSTLPKGTALPRQLLYQGTQKSLFRGSSLSFIELSGGPEQRSFSIGFKPHYPNAKSLADKIRPKFEKSDRKDTLEALAYVSLKPVLEAIKGEE
jgi:hypothetical protein